MDALVDEDTRVDDDALVEVEDALVELEVRIEETG